MGSWQLAVATAALTCAIAAAVLARELSHVGVHQGYAPAQPIAFSHKLHAGDLQIQCTYCHFAAEKSRHAGIPPLNVCMNCHSGVTATLAAVKLEEQNAQQQNRPAQPGVGGQDVGDVLAGRRGSVLHSLFSFCQLGIGRVERAAGVVPGRIRHVPGIDRLGSAQASITPTKSVS